MILLLTDFGWNGPYVGQMKAVLHARAPGIAQLDLMHDLPACGVEAAAYLLPALLRDMPAGGVYLCVVDPGVGSARGAIALQIGARWFIGPDNGLFDRLAASAEEVSWFDIHWRPDRLSDSFHGRDLFAPVAAAIAIGEQAHYLTPCSAKALRYTASVLYRVIYIDDFGNAMTGVAAHAVDREHCFQVAEHQLTYARTFSEVSAGQPFWYENSLGLVEFSINQGSAQQRLGLAVGTAFSDY